ncbi:hypothetical protein TNCV_1948321 [Trichonephila clavipes]|nr:hypothetical protein TNCV_1948321 [Trichonephila clavipes]
MAIVSTMLYFLLSLLGLTVPHENADVNAFVSTRITLATQYPQVGKPLQIDCHVTGPSGVQVTWHKDGQLLSSSNRVKIMSNHTLLISSAENQDSGSYRCSARYQNSQSSSSIYIQINVLFQINKDTVRLRWLGYIWRSPENNQTRAYTFKNPMGSRTRGRSPTRRI